MTGNLYIQVDSGDTGMRQYNACANFWTNQSIWMSGGVDQTTTQVGDQTTINVRVHSSGDAAVPFVKVQAWVLSTQVGLASPGQAIATFSSSVATVAPGAAGTVFPCGPWTPTAAQLPDSPNHLCLAANAYQDPNLANPPLDGRFLQPTDSFDMCNDAHQGQRNIVLLAAAPGAPTPKMKINVNGPEDPRLAVTLSATKLLAKQAQGWNERWLLNSHPNIGLQEIDGRERLGIFSQNGEFQRLGFSRIHPKPVVGVEKFGEGPSIRLKGAAQTETASIDFGLTREEPLGAMHAFDVVLRTPTGAQFGSGLRVLTVVVPD